MRSNPRKTSGSFIFFYFGKKMFEQDVSEIDFASFTYRYTVRVLSLIHI